jgi:hypothetical protein
MKPLSRTIIRRAIFDIPTARRINTGYRHFRLPKRLNDSWERLADFTRETEPWTHRPINMDYGMRKINSRSSIVTEYGIHNVMCFLQRCLEISHEGNAQILALDA